MTGRIGVYGGSFNPIHAGHIGIARRAATEYGLERVLVVPAKTNPFKTDLKDAMFSDAQRWAMVQAACATYPELIPCDMELVRGGVSYTVDTLRALQQNNPSSQIFFIIGDDSVPGLKHWKEWDELQKLATFVSYPRTPESSTEIRRRLASGEDISGLVPSAVAKLIAGWGVGKYA